MVPLIEIFFERYINDPQIFLPFHLFDYDLRKRYLLCSVIKWVGDGFFERKIGDRMSDPISTLLFVICLIYIFSLTYPPCHFLYTQECDSFHLAHLTFANDLVLFCCVDLKLLKWLKKMFRDFHAISGLVVNLSKSDSFFSTVSDAS